MFCMDAGRKIHEGKKAYGAILQTIRRAESLERAIRNGYSGQDIAKAVEHYKQAAARSGPIIVHSSILASGEYGITQGKRA